MNVKDDKIVELSAGISVICCWSYLVQRWSLL